MTGPYSLDKETLRQHFEQASANGADLMLHVAHTDLDFGKSLVLLMDYYTTFEETLAVRLNDENSIAGAAAFFGRDHACIQGVYDVKKPFDRAAFDPAALPAVLQNSIRDSLFAKELQPWFKKLCLFTESRKQAYKSRIPIPVNNPQQ